MKTFFRHYLLQCALGLILSSACSLMAQAPASPAPAAGGGAAKQGPSNGAARSTNGTNTTRTGATANRNTTAAPAAATPGTTTGTGTNATGTTPTNNTGTNATGTNATGTNATGTNATGTNATGTNAARTNATGTNATGTNAPGTATATNATGTTTTTGTTNTTGTNSNGSRTNGIPNQAGVNSTSGTAALPAGTVTSSGMITNFGANDFSLQGATTTSPNATPSDFLIGPDTLFVDSLGNNIPRDRFFRRGSNVPATVYYSRSPNGGLVASKVVLTENQTAAAAPVESAGTITEVSPGILVIEQPGASDTPVRYVNNKTTNYVNENGEPVAADSVKAGTPVKIFYTKVGDTLVASKVEVHRNNGAGLPKPVVPAEQSSTRPAKK